jgi:hypothetical protein
VLANSGTPHGVEELFEGGALVEVGICPGKETRRYVLLGVVGGVDEDVRRLRQGLYPAELDTVRLFAQVEP